MIMQRYQQERAAARVHTYEDITPSERALDQRLPAFDRAKAKWMRVAQQSLDEVAQLTFEQYMLIRNPGTARKPHECPECGHDSEVQP